MTSWIDDLFIKLCAGQHWHELLEFMTMLGERYGMGFIVC